MHTKDATQGPNAAPPLLRDAARHHRAVDRALWPHRLRPAARRREAPRGVLRGAARGGAGVLGHDAHDVLLANVMISK